VQCPFTLHSIAFHHVEVFSTQKVTEYGVKFELTSFRVYIVTYVVVIMIKESLKSMNNIAKVIPYHTIPSFYFRQ